MRDKLENMMYEVANREVVLSNFGGKDAIGM